MNQYVLSLSYGKDSLACLGAIEKLGWPLDRIVHAEIWATDTIPADLPPMLEFKQRADAIIKERWGIEVEHVCAIQKDGTKQTYEKIFYRTPKRKLGGKFKDGTPAGFPYTKGAWCNDRLKTNPLDAISHTPPPNGFTGSPCGREIGAIQTSREQLFNNSFHDYGVRKPMAAVLHGRTQEGCNQSPFLIAPYRRALTKILWCNT